MLELKNITKKFGTNFILSNINTQIHSGMNFIIGKSGSGKTTLLNLISAMDTEYEGDILFNGKSLKSLSAQEKQSLYSSRLGIVGQSFYLIESLTVMENILLPTQISNESPQTELSKILRKTGLTKLANEKVLHLSSGQKQRVVVARELLKNPDVIIADEPTSALDPTSTKEIMDILREIAKARTVIIVSHDKSLITPSDNVFELSDGNISTVSNNPKTEKKREKTISQPKLSLKHCFNIALCNIKQSYIRSMCVVLSLVFCALCLTYSFASVDNQSENTFDLLLQKYGNSILNLNIVSSFMSASGGDENEDSKSVEQEIGDLIAKYQNDERVEHIISSTAFLDMVIELDEKPYIIQSSGQAPSFNKLIAGRMANNDSMELVVSNEFVKSNGLSPEDILGKKILFRGGVYNWDSGQPVLMDVTTEVEIVGVADTSYVVDFEDKSYRYEHEDSLFFSFAALEDMLNQANKNFDKSSFFIRAKSPKDVVSLNDELMSNGIVPLARVELLRDMVALEGRTVEQTQLISTVLLIIAMGGTIALSLLIGIARRREYAVYQMNGFSKTHTFAISSMEQMLLACVSIVISTMASLLFFGNYTILMACLSVINLAVVGILVAGLIITTTTPKMVFKNGGR